ncbi:MAG: HDOD domain-containing protein [Syntrophus sp. (in: bacteria)]
MLEKILRSINKLPAFPATVQRVAELLRNEDYSVNEIVAVIKFDQAITANILKISNSAYFGVRQKIKTIHDAVVYLGQQHLIRAIQTASISKFFTKKGYGDKASELWEHSVAVALMSQILSRQLHQKENPVLYTAALLHDVGKLVLGEYVQDASKKIFELVNHHGYSFLEAEEEIVGINHADLGGRIAEYWNFPAEIRDAIALHHRPNFVDLEENVIPSLVFLADQFCLTMGIDGGMDGLAHRGFSEVTKKFQLRESDVEKNMLLLLDQLKQANELLRIVDK